MHEAADLAQDHDRRNALMFDGDSSDHAGHKEPKAIGAGQRSRAWAVTVFFDDFKLYSVSPYDESTMNYFGWVMHVCTKTDRLHYHVLVYFKSQRVRSAAQQAARGPRAYCKPVRRMNGAIAYLHKFDEKHVAVDGPVEYGVAPSQGHRTDFEHAAYMLKSGSDVRSIVEESPGMMRYMHMMDAYVATLPYDRIDPLADKTLYGYQQRVMDLLAEPRVPRRILWVWSSDSSAGYGAGKTSLAEHIMCVMPTLAGVADDAAATAYALGRQHVCVLFALPRDYLFVDCGVLTRQLETYSDGGTVLSRKYQSCVKTFYGHVVVLCNHQPLVRLADRILSIEAVKD